jgi:hypothetical protein
MTRHKKPNIAHDELTQLVNYDLNTGVFTRRFSRGDHAPGSLIGGKSPQGYWYIGVGGKQYPAHRLAWFYVNKEWPDGDVDHINRDRLDNRIANLRVTNRSFNIHNTDIAKGVSGVRGVSKTSYGKWEARIEIQRVGYQIGTFNTIEEAAEARRFVEAVFVNKPRGRS